MSNTSPIRISKQVSRKIVKPIQLENNFPIENNDSLVIAVATFRFSNDYFHPDTNKKRFHKEILEDIQVMQEEGLLDRNIKGYEIPCDHELKHVEVFVSKNKNKIHYCNKCKTILKGVLKK